MKTVFMLSITVLFCSLQAQEADISDIAAPSYPAFAILGIAPSEINRPGTFSPFMISIADLFDKDGIPTDFALEVTPYWWWSHPDLTFEEYQRKSGFMDATLPTLAFSFGTSSMEDALGTSVSAGIRANLLNGAGIDSRELDELIATLQEMQLEALRKLGNAEPDGPVADSIEQALEPISREISRLSQERIDFRLELASACALSVPGDIWDSASVDRWGVWITGSYRANRGSDVYHHSHSWLPLNT